MYNDVVGTNSHRFQILFRSFLAHISFKYVVDVRAVALLQLFDVFLIQKLTDGVPLEEATIVGDWVI